jgi:hypothetical protein
MKNITRRGSLFLLCIFTVLFSLIFTVSAFAITEGDWEFKLLDNEAIITGYHGAGGDVVIPSSLYGASVVKIEGYGIFEKNVKSIVFPSTMKEIGAESCKGSEDLEKIIVNEGVQIIGKSAFKDSHKLSSISLPSTLIEIEGGYYEGAFEYCKALTQISFPNGMKKIGRDAFGYSGLEVVDLTNVEDAPNLVGIAAFKGCENLVSVKLNEGLKVIDNAAFYNCSSLSDVAFPSTLEKINHNAFDGCSSLSQIVLPTSLKRIEDAGFYGCSFKEVVVPVGVSEIDAIVFGGNDNLEAVYLPDTVEKIDRPTQNSPNAIIFCSENSKVAELCKKDKISYMTDNSVNCGIIVRYNGKRISFQKYDQNPEIVDNRTLVPLRAIFESMDADVNWNQDTQTVTATRNNVTISLTIGSEVMNKNGEDVSVDVPARIINGRTMIPVRVIAEAFGADVQWNASGKTILINE